MNFKLLDDLGIKYIIKPIKTKKGQIIGKRRIAMSFLANGKLSIRYTPEIAINDVNAFIEKNLKWIKKNYASKQPIIRELKNGEKYLYLGKEYFIEVFQSNYPEVIIKENKLIIYAKDLNHFSLTKILDNWKTNMAEMVFNELLIKIFTKMGSYLTKYPILQIKDYKSRWGCCYYKLNKIILNRNLIHVPIELIEYVIYHELSHLIFPNHGDKFHIFLKQFIPNEKLLKKQLSQYRPFYY